MKKRNNQSNADETILNQSITRRSFVKRGAVASAATIFGIATIQQASAVENGVYGYDMTIPVPAAGLPGNLSSGLGNNQGPNANGLPDGPDVGLLVKKAIEALGGAVTRDVSSYHEPCAMVITPQPAMGIMRNTDGSASILNHSFGPSANNQPQTINISIRWGTPR